MDLKHLKYIVTIAEEKSLTKAAQKLYVSQSTLSLYLGKLEKELNMPLFRRIKNGLIPTPAGELYISTCRKMLALQDELYQNLQLVGPSPTKSTFRLGISSQLGLSIFGKAFSIFKPEHPNINVTVTEGRARTLLSKLEKRELNCIIIGHDSIIENPSYHVDIIKKEAVSLVLAPTHPLAYLASCNYNDPPVADMHLFQNSNIVLSPRDTSDYRIALRVIKDYQMNANVACELNDTEALCRMVLQSSYISIIPGFCVPRNMGLLVCQPDKPYYRYLLLLYHQDSPPSQDAELLLKLIKNYYENWYEKTM